MATSCLTVTMETSLWRQFMKGDGAIGPHLLQSNEDGNHSQTGVQGPQRLADDGAKSPVRIGRLHSVSGRRRGGEQIADLNRRILSVHLATDLAYQSYRQAA